MTTVKVSTDKILFGIVLVVLVFALFQAFQLNSLKSSIESGVTGSVISKDIAPAAAMSHGSSQGFNLNVPDSGGCAPT